MSGKRYTGEFRAEAVRQVIDRGHRVPDVAARLGITEHSLYRWVRKVTDSASLPAPRARRDNPTPILGSTVVEAQHVLGTTLHDRALEVHPIAARLADRHTSARPTQSLTPTLTPSITSPMMTCLRTR